MLTSPSCCPVHSTDCRNTIDGRFHCESNQNSIFLGILDGEDLVWTNAGSSVPTAGVVIQHDAKACPRLERNEPTLPVRSKYTCIDVAKNIGRAIPPDKVLGRTEFEVLTVNIAELPKHTCFIDKINTERSSSPRWEVVWNEGLEGVPWDQQDVIDLEKVRINEGNRYADIKLRYASLCLKPFVNYRETAPPSPPAAGAGAAYKLLTRNQLCETITDPCECCTSKQQANESAPIEDCVVAPQGTTFTELTSSATTTVTGMCSTLNAIKATGIGADENIGSCSSIRPFCYPSPTSVVFSPLGGTRYETLCSATLYLDVYHRFQGIVVGTSSGSSNSMLYISRSDVVQRPLSGDPMEHSVAVSTSRLKGDTELICCESLRVSNIIPANPKFRPLDIYCALVCSCQLQRKGDFKNRICSTTPDLPYTHVSLCVCRIAAICSSSTRSGPRLCKTTRSRPRALPRSTRGRKSCPTR
jgi:hypothetical protein